MSGKGGVGARSGWLRGEREQSVGCLGDFFPVPGSPSSAGTALASFEFASLGLGESDMDIIESLITNREPGSPPSGHLRADV